MGRRARSAPDGRSWRIPATGSRLRPRDYVRPCLTSAKGLFPSPGTLAVPLQTLAASGSMKGRGKRAITSPITPCREMRDSPTVPGAPNVLATRSARSWSISYNAHELGARQAAAFLRVVLPRTHQRLRPPTFNLSWSSPLS